jgi:hypothetical protein
LTRQMRRSSRRRISTSSACNASSHSPKVSQGMFSPFTTLSRSKSPPPVQPSPCVHQAHSILRRSPKPSRPELGYKLCVRC